MIRITCTCTAEFYSESEFALHCATNPSHSLYEEWRLLCPSPPHDHEQYERVRRAGATTMRARLRKLRINK
jgi:hypothetical protein